MPEVWWQPRLFRCQSLTARWPSCPIRVSGVSHGAIGVHCAPEAAIGGPIGLVEDGDTIGFDLLQGTIDWDVSEAVVNERREKKNLSQPTHQRGYLAGFSATVSQAHEGCVSHWVLSKEPGRR